MLDYEGQMLEVVSLDNVLLNCVLKALNRSNS